MQTSKSKMSLKNVTKDGGRGLTRVLPLKADYAKRILYNGINTLFRKLLDISSYIFIYTSSTASLLQINFFDLKILLSFRIPYILTPSSFLRAIPVILSLIFNIFF